MCGRYPSRVPAPWYIPDKRLKGHIRLINPRGDGRRAEGESGEEAIRGAIMLCPLGGRRRRAGWGSHGHAPRGEMSCAFAGACETSGTQLWRERAIAVCAVAVPAPPRSHSQRRLQDRAREDLRTPTNLVALSILLGSCHQTPPLLSSEPSFVLRFESTCMPACMHVPVV